MMNGYGPGYGPGMMGGGYGPRSGQGYGPGMMGNDWRRFHRGPWNDRANNRGQDNDRSQENSNGPENSNGRENFRGRVTADLTPDNVKNFFERLIADQGNKRLKVGDVKEKDADTIVADIVTKDNSLVQRFAVNRHNGFYKPEED